MGGRELWLVWLLTQTFHINGEETLVKTIGSEPDLTPLCTNTTEDIITLIVCRIRTERNREECRLLYQYGHDFENNCDSRFRLVMEKETVFLHLNSLTPVDSGTFSCQCSHLDGTDTLLLNITVEEDGADSRPAQTPFSHAVAGVLVFLVVVGVIMGLVLRAHHGRRQQLPIGFPDCAEPQTPEPYLTFIQRENELYSASTVHSSTSCDDGEDTRPMVSLR